MIDSTVMLFTMFFLKHFVCDFPLQGPYQYLNKGTYGHFGGIVHSLIQVAGTALVIWTWVPLSLLFKIIAFEFIVHYHIDWAKMNLNKSFNLTPTNSEQFWWLVGFDQLLHYLTYSVIVWIIIQ